MFDRFDQGSQNGFGNKELISELELTNLINIATNPKLGVQLDEEYLKNLRFILQKIAEEKIDRMTRQFKVNEEYETKKR